MKLRRMTWVIIALAVLGLAGTYVYRQATRHGCESNPYEQFRMNGITYWGPTKAIDQDQLGAKVGMIDKRMPKAAVRCGKYTLSDGQGTASLGSKVYAVKGEPESLVLAAVDAETGSVRQYHSSPVPLRRPTWTSQRCYM